MKKIALIIQREYLSRVKKKSFILMTFLGPLLFTGMYALAIWLAINSDEMNDKKIVTVVDDSRSFSNSFKNSNTLSFEFNEEALDEAKKNFKNSGNDFLLYIPALTDDNIKGIELYSEKQPGMTIVNYIEQAIESSIEDKKLISYGIEKSVLENLNVKVDIHTIRITDKGEETGSTGASSGIGLVAGILIYMFIFLYGVQVMRGVIEEKSNRIVEIIISSVKPFQLMMGKIIGIALVGLTQFALWVILFSALSGLVTSQMSEITAATQMEQLDSLPSETVSIDNSFKENGIAAVMNALETIDFTLIIACFVFYFLAGYLLYSALFAAIGAAVDNESETQQFMLPVTIPLIFSLVLSTSAIINNPEGPLAFWLSLIPLTSPVVMMVRLPFGVPAWQIFTSMAILILGFLGTVWIAGRIYRTGILMYGKKVNFKELMKWVRIKS